MCVHIHPFPVNYCRSRTGQHFFADDTSLESPQRKMQSWNWTHNIHVLSWKEKNKRFFLFIPENPWYLLLTICNYGSVWHHQPKGWCWLSGIVCEWRGRLHPCSWILFAGSFLGCQQRFISGSLITCRDGGGGRRDHSTLSPYFYATYSLFTTSFCRTAACHQSSVFS